MTREDCLTDLLKIYDVVAVLSEKNSCKGLSVLQINELLYSYGLETLG